MKKKMFIAGMSLAVALILLATASFAFITISTAPEAKGMNMTLYTSRTLLLAPGNGTNTAPAKDEFKQYISLSSDFAGLAPLRPVSTADGINWFLPAYSTDSGGIGQISEFVLDNTLEHGNVSLLDANGNYLTDGDLQQAVNKGYYVYTDFWLMTEEAGAKVRLSIPHLYGTAEERHSGTVTEYGLDANELQSAVYGTYVLGEPELDSTDPTKLAVRTEEPETALRLGFLVYQNTETLNPVIDGIGSNGIPPESISLPFKIYEPNADKRAGGADQELIIPDASGSTVAKREDYIVGSDNSELADNTYYVTQPIAKAADGGIELTTVSPEDMIVQLKSEWDNTSVIATLNGQWGNSILKANSNDVKTFGQFLKTEAFTTTVNKPVPVSTEAGMTDIAGSNVIVELKKNTPIRVRLFVWLEGQDVDCWNDIATGTFRINLELAGETVYREEEEEPEPISVCGTLKQDWFNGSAARFDKAGITAIEFTKTVPKNYASTWNAGTETGIYAYTDADQKVYIVVPEGEEAISLPENSSGLFAYLDNCVSITGMQYLDTAGVTDMNNMFHNSSKLQSLDLSSFDTSAVTNMEGMFINCGRLKSINVSSFDTSNVTTMRIMFLACGSVTSLDTTGWDTSKVTDMYAMFHMCCDLATLDVSRWDTSQVTNMDGMFYTCESLRTLDVSNWDTSNVTDMGGMFMNCYNVRPDVSGWDTSKVTNMYAMFFRSRAGSLDLSGWDTSNVTNMRSMFAQSSIQTVYVGSSWDTSSVTDSTNMFEVARSIRGGNGTTYDENHIDKTYARIDTAATPGYFTAKEGLSVLQCTLKGFGTDGNSSDGWFDAGAAGITRDQITEIEFTYSAANAGANTWNASVGQGGITAAAEGTKVYLILPDSSQKFILPQNSASIFSTLTSCTAITGLDLADTSKVMNMAYMFKYDSALAGLDLSEFNTARVTNMGAMFARCSSLETLDLSKFNTSGVTRMESMFESCTALGLVNLSSFDTGRVTNMISMFNGCSSLQSLDLSGFNTSSVVNMGWMFYKCEALTALDLTSFNTSKVTSMVSMFDQCTALANLDVSSFNTANVTDMSFMFYRCNRLNGLNLEGFNTSRVTTMLSMFDQCSDLTCLDIGSFDSTSVQDVSYMFDYCSKLSTVYAGPDWSTAAVTNDTDMFLGAVSLVGGNGTVYEADHTDKTYARIDAAGTPGYFTEQPSCVLAKDWCKAPTMGITAIEFTKKAPASSSKDWIAGTCTGDGEVRAYLTAENKVFIVLPAGADKIAFPQNSSSLFSMATSCTSIEGLQYVDTTAVTDMSYMFLRCYQLTSLDLSSFNTSSVTNMERMFNDCQSLTSLNVSGFNTAHVTNMANMFMGCRQLVLLDVSRWDTSSVTNMSLMFYGMSKLADLNISSWDISSVTTLNMMFYECDALVNLDLSGWDTSAVTDMDRVFQNCDRLTSLDLSGWSTAEVTTMTWMFGYCGSLRTVYVNPDWDTSKAKGGVSVFTANGNLVGGNGTVYNFDNRFKDYARIDKAGAPGYFTDKTQMPATLKGYGTDGNSSDGWFDSSAAGITRNQITVLEFVTSVPTGYTKTWNAGRGTGAKAVNAYLKGTTVSIVVPAGTDRIFLPEDSLNVFKEMTACRAIYGAEHLDTSKVTRMYCTFAYCWNLGSIDVSSWNTSNVTDMGGLFFCCPFITELETGSWDTSNVTSMYCMFYDNTRLAGLDVSNWNTSKVTDMAMMFHGCAGLTEIDASNWNTSNVTDMYNMFGDCSSLRTIYAGTGWDTSNVTRGNKMFELCTGIVGGNGTTYDGNHLDKTYARIDKPGQPGYFTDKNAPKTVTCTLKGYGTGGNSSDGWFDSSKAGVTRDQITALEFVKSVPTGYTATWNAGTGTGTEAVNAYLTGTTVSIVLPDGADKIALPADSSYLFDSMTACESIEGLGLLDTSNVTTMKGMFMWTVAESIDISGFDTSNVTTVERMFMNSDVSNVTLGALDMQKVTTMANMFRYAYNLTSVDMSKVKTSTALTDVSYMFGMEAGWSKLTSIDITGLNTTNCTSLNGLIRMTGNTLTEIKGLEDLNTGNVTTMAYMLYNTRITSLDLSKWNVSRVTNMTNAFTNNRELVTLDLTGWNTANVTNINSMFCYCSNLTTIYASPSFVTTNVTGSNDGKDVFLDCNKLEGGNETTYSASYTNKTYARIDAAGTPGYFTDKNALVVCTMKGFGTHGYDSNGWFDRSFAGIARDAITGVVFTRNVPTGQGATWDAGVNPGDITAKIVGTTVYLIPRDGAVIGFPANSYRLFRGLSNCTSISGFDLVDTSDVTNMTSMFHDCSKLTSLDVSGFNTSSVTNMQCMFYNCGALKKIYSGAGFTTANVTTSSGMFTGCTDLVGGNGTPYSASNTDKTYARIDRAGQPGYFTAK